MTSRFRLAHLAAALLASSTLASGTLPAAGEAAAPPSEIQTLLATCWETAVADPRAAIPFVEEALARAAEVSAEPDGPSAIAELGLCQGYAEEQLGSIDRAREAYQRAVEEGERLGDSGLLAKALAQRGELAYYFGDFTAALADLDRAYRAELELDRRSRQLYLLNAIANVYADPRVAAYDQAIDFYRQTLVAHEASGDLANQSTAHFNLGSTYERQGDLAAALAELEHAAALERRRGDADELAFVERAVGALLVKLGREREALARLDPVVAHYRATGDPESLAAARLTRGIARRAAGDLAGALDDLDAAAERFDAGGNDRYLARAEEERAEALAARGDFAAALAARSRQSALERRLAEATRDEQVTRLRVRFDSEKKEAENRALARENELRGQALRDAERIEALQRAVLALAAILLALLAALAGRQLRRARRLHVLAMTDELTRLPNRRALLAMARQALDGARRSDGVLSLLALDVDHFKRVNDTLGHEAGDVVLQRVAQAARRALRDGDAIGRVGGEEFLALLPATTLAGALEVGERLRAAVAALDVTDLAPGFAVTASLGAAERRADEMSVEAVARRADEALYRAKQNGRNRVEPAPPQQET